MGFCILRPHHATEARNAVVHLYAGGVKNGTVIIAEETGPANIDSDAHLECPTWPFVAKRCPRTVQESQTD
jgi:hypothetical protein